MPSSSYLKSIGIVLIALLVMTVLVQHSKNEVLRVKLNTAEQLVISSQSTIDNMQEQNEKMAQQYVKQQKEYENAQSKISDLERDLLSGSKRLRINATCHSSMSSKSSTASVDDERTAKPTRDAEQNYIRLRQQITLITAQTKGLQSYIESLPKECVAR